MQRTTLRLIGATIGLLVGAFAASPAMAAYDFTQSQITSPGDPYVVLDKATDPTPEVTVSGTTNATAASLNVNIRCYYTEYYGGSDYYTLGSTTTNADGSFSDTFSVSNLSNNYQACRLRAVPDGPPSDLGSFRGPRAQVTYWDPDNSTYQIHGGDATYRSGDYYVDAPGFRGAVEFYSAGDYGLSYFSPGVSNREPSTTPDANDYGWYHGDGLRDGDWNGNGSAIRVDDQNAYNAYGTPVQDYDGIDPEGPRKPAGWQPISSDVQVAPNGDVKITEIDTFWLCDDPSVYPATPTSCPNVHDSGVHFTRVYLRTNDATRIDVTDTMASTDNQPHNMFLQYYNWVYQYSSYPAWHFEGEPASSWAVAGDDTQLDTPGTPGGIAFRDGEYPDDQYETANGSLVWLTQPSRIWFNDDSEYPLVEHNVSIPAGGSATVQHVFQVANLSGSALDQMNGVLDKQGSPVVTFSSPANGTATNSDHATLTGKATDNKGVSSLKINGTSVALAPDGTFSFPATLAQGANTFNAVATDASGNTGTATLSLTYVKPDPLAPLCKVPSVKAKSKLSAAKTKLTAANCTPKTHKLFSSKVEKGRVIGLSAKAGQVFVPKANITVNVSKGKKKHKKH